MINQWAGPWGRVAGSLILVAASMLLPVSAASAAPMDSATPMDIAVLRALQDQDRCVGNGQFIRPGSRTGRGELTITNGLDRDAVVTLTEAKRPVYSVAVCKGAQYTVSGIQDGTYEMFFTTGADWDSQSRTFTRDPTFQRFDDPLTFTTTRTATGTQWSTWTITLHGVSGGTAKTSPVNRNDYPTP